MKRVHIWDLPTHKIYIKFNDNFRKLFFHQIYNYFGNFNLAGKFLDIKRPDTTLARDWKNGLTSHPLDIAIKLANKTGIPLNKLERNIEKIQYKTRKKRGGNNGKPIINPKLPIIIDEDFIEILGHICGDGTLSRSNPKKGINLKYINSEPTLIKSFMKLIKKRFGEVEPNIQIREGRGYRRKNFVLQYPTILSIIILSIFDYKTKEHMNFPKFISNASITAKTRFLRALFDDEGHIPKNNKNIQFGLKPIKPLLKTKNLLEELGIKCGKIRNDNGQNRFQIAEQESILKFSKIIGFKHPKKNNRLNKILLKGWKFKRYENNQAKEKIINMLTLNKILSTYEISKGLKRSKTTTHHHLNRLKKEHKISYNTVQKRINNTNTFQKLWFLKENVKQI